MPKPKMDIESIVASKKSGGGWARALRWGAVLGALALAGWYLSSRDANEAAAVYVVEPARVADIVVNVTATGTVEPVAVSDVSSELSGTIVSVEVAYNDPVTEGQILARFDTEQLEAALEQAQATLVAREARVAESEATYSEAHAQYERAISLQISGVVSLEQLTSAQAGFQRAQAALNIAKADVRIAKAALHSAEVNLEKACICAPIDGVILDMDVVEGQIVQSALQSQPLFLVSQDLVQVVLHIDIDEADIGKVAIGNPADFSVEAYQGERFSAVVSEIRYSPQTIEGVVSYKAVLAAENADLRLLPGMTATAEILVSEVKEALVVPNAAFRYAPPVIVEEDSESSAGLLGILFSNTPDFAPSARNEPDADGRRIIWLDRDGVAVAVKVLPGASDGVVTQISDGEVMDGDLVIIDQETAR